MKKILYGDYRNCYSYKNLNEASDIMTTAADVLNDLSTDGESVRLVDFQVIIKDKTIGWKATVEVEK